MLTTAVLIAALSLAPGQAGRLDLTNVRTTYGPLGISRSDTRLLPGDSFCISFDIEGITVDRGGKVLYSMTTVFTDSKGKTVFKQEPRDLEAINALGGSTV